MYFRMAEGVGTGSIPRDFFQWPINYTFYSGRLIPDYAGQLKAYVAAHAIRTIIVADGAPGPWARLFTALGGEPLRVGGVTLYPVPERLSATRPLTPLEIEARSNLALAASLVATAHSYLSHGIPLSELTPLDAEQRDLLPRYWGGYVASQSSGGRRLEFSTRTGLWLGPWDAGTISIDLTASGQTIGPLVARYGAMAQRVYFPYPQPLTAGAARGGGVLLLRFTHDGIRRAAAMSEAAMPP